MSNLADEIATKHNLDEHQRKLYDEYLACVAGEAVNDKLATTLESKVERDRAEKEASEYAARLWELKHEIGITVAQAIREYLISTYL